MPHLVPVVTVLFGLIYGLFFYLIGFRNIYIRGGLLIGLSLFEPFAFNWFKPQIIFINSYLGTELWQFGLVVLSTALFIKYRKPIALLPIVATLHISDGEVDYKLPFPISAVETEVAQDQKWIEENQYSIVEMNLKKIKEAIDSGYSMVVLPESTFPLFLNKRRDILDILLTMSEKITIWSGGLLYEDGFFYNSAYIFHKGEYQTAKKMVLVPFGEYVPLGFLADIINKIFFDGAEDFSPAETPTDVEVNGRVFRNAICYEATSEELYIGSPEFMIAISNNAWFMPSIEPTLQKLLIKHYASIYGVTVIHSANIFGTGIVYPR
jgi:apolipoprotein N-acyltransferase